MKRHLCLALVVVFAGAFLGGCSSGGEEKGVDLGKVETATNKDGTPKASGKKGAAGFEGSLD